MLGLVARFATVPGECRCRNTRCSSSQTAVVPLGERFAVPSGQTVATNPSRCPETIRRMSSWSFIFFFHDQATHSVALDADAFCVVCFGVPDNGEDRSGAYD